jgi:hypothetical protein
LDASHCRIKACLERRAAAPEARFAVSAVRLLHRRDTRSQVIENVAFVGAREAGPQKAANHVFDVSVRDASLRGLCAGAD